MRVYETTGSSDGSELNWKYEIRQSFFECLKDFFFVPLPVGPCESQSWKIITKQKATRGPAFKEEVDLFQVDMRNREVYETTTIDDLDYGLIHKEFSHCVKEFLGRGTNYRVRFPRTATVD